MLIFTQFWSMTAVMTMKTTTMMMMMMMMMMVFSSPHPVTGNPCCSYPCQNEGVCMTMGHDSYICDCTNLDFYGDHCEHRKCRQLDCSGNL